MVGLGTGSVSCYALPGQKLVFYEIDPAVKALVADSDRFFTYVRDARNRGADVVIRMGDARLKLKEDVDARYALLFVDAFSSDAIPVHLITREAVQLYMDRLTEDGILALHISNKYVALEPVVAAIAQDLGLEARIWNDSSERHIGKTASSWVVLARNRQTLGTLALPPEEQQKYGTDFRPLNPLKNMEAWTDDYADVLRVMMLDEVRRLRKLFGLPTYRDED
jgi:spermidine synthase